MHYPLKLAQVFVLFWTVWLVFGNSGGERVQTQFDRLDGKGRSGVVVDVIEWEGHLELHITPKGQLLGLAARIDRKQKDRPVMIIGYRFQAHPEEQLIRRAVLSIPLQDGFKAFRDTGVSDFDKVMIANENLAGGSVIVYRFEEKLSGDYPAEHPLAVAASQEAKSVERKPSSPQKPPVQNDHQTDGALEGPSGRQAGHSTGNQIFDSDSGTIRFNW